MFRLRPMKLVGLTPQEVLLAGPNQNPRWLVLPIGTSIWQICVISPSRGKNDKALEHIAWKSPPNDHDSFIVHAVPGSTEHG